MAPVKHLRRPNVLAASVSIYAAGLGAQQASILRGTVVDPSGAPVAGVAVELALANGLVQAQGVTLSDGGFAFAPVPAGSYTLAVYAAKGFAAQSRIVHVGDTTSALRVTLVPNSVSQSVDVQSGAALSAGAADNQDSVAIAASTLDHLPVFDQDIVGALTPFLDPAATSTSGVSIVVDGIELPNGANISPSAISEVRINSDPYSAEFASPGRGRLEITTKPGSPQFHGTLNFIARDAVFNAKNYFSPTKPDEQRRIYEGHITGPVVHGGHTTFLISGTRQEEDLQSAVHAVGTQGVIAQNFATPSNNSQVSGRITHDFSQAHRLAVSYNFRYISQSASNVGGIVLPEAAINESNRQDQILFNDRVILSPDIVQQLQVLLERETDSQFSTTNAQSILVSDSFAAGGAQTDIYRTEHTLGLIDVVGWTHRNHYVRFGVNIPQMSRRAVDDLSNRLGTFSFLSLADYTANNPYSFTVQQGRGRGTYYATEVGAFAQDEITLRKNLQLTAGIRYQWQTYLTTYGNFAPRVSLSYAPSTKWVLRAGSGIFYDRTGGDFLVTFKLHNGVNLRQYQVLNPGYPTPLPPGQSFSVIPTNLVVEPKHMSAAYQVQYSGTAERQLSAGLTVTATYRGITGIRTFRSRDINAPLPPYTLLPNPSIGFVQQVEAEGRMRLNAVDLGLRGSIHHAKTTWFQGQVQYTYSRTNNNTGGVNWYPQDQYNPDAEYSRADLDRRQRFNLLGTVHPGHWLTLGVASALYSGLPYTELAGSDLFNTGLGNARPAGVGRNTLQGGGTATLDLLWDHDFHLNQAKGDKAKLINLGASGFNVLNKTNFTHYIGNIQSAFFGNPTTALAGRQMQFSIRYEF